MCSWPCFIRRVVSSEITLLFVSYITLSLMYFMYWISSLLGWFSIEMSYIDYITMPLVETIIGVLAGLVFIYCCIDCCMGCGGV